MTPVGWRVASSGSRDADTIYEATARPGSARTAFGDDKDRVVIRSNGLPTYFASDIGYLARSSAAASTS